MMSLGIAKREILKVRMILGYGTMYHHQHLTIHLKRAFGADPNRGLYLSLITERAHIKQEGVHDNVEVRIAG